MTDERPPNTEDREAKTEREQDVEDARTALSAAGPAARRESRGADSRSPTRVSDLDSWRSPLAGVCSSGVAEQRSGLAPPGEERLRVGELLREEAGRQVFAATELDLDRAVEVHLGGPGTPPDAVLEAARLHGRIAGAAVPVLYEAGRMPDGRPYLLLSRPPGKPLADLVARIHSGPAGASHRRELVGALARVARAVHRAHQRGVAHLALDGSTVHVGRHGEALVTGWGSPRALGAPRPDVAPDVQALGHLVAVVSFEKGSRRRGGRAVAGLPPELAAIVARATGKGRSGRYRSAHDLARDLESALSGEAVAAGRSPFLRRLARFSRRHPYAVLVSSLLLAAGLVLAAIFGLQARRRADLDAAKRASEREARLARAARYLDETTEPARQLNEALAEEGRAFAAMRDEHARATGPGLWNGPGVGSEPGSSTSRDRRHEAELESRAALAGILDLVGHSLEILREPERGGATPDMASDPARGNLEREATEVAVRSLLARVEADLALARFEEERDLSARTIPQARRTRALREILSEILAGDSAGLERGGATPDMAAFRAALSGVAEPWKQAALGLARLGGLVGGRERPEEERIARALAEFRPVGRLVVGPVPEGLVASIREVDVAGDAFAFGTPEEMRSAEVVELPVGEVLLVLEDGTREVRLPVLLSRGETFEWSPEWPGEFPPGDFVYVPAGRFRAGGGAPQAGPYREERVERGCFVALREVSLREYLEFLADLKAGGREELLRSCLPSAGQGVFLVAPDLSITRRGYDPEFPVIGVSRDDADVYARWLSLRSGGVWEYRLPTEAEWEFSARGASGRDYPWGDVWLEDRAAVGGSESLGYLATGSSPAGASVFGTLHVCGNALEWTTGEMQSGLGVIRGGSVHTTSELARTAARIPLHSAAKGIGVGIRLVCVRRE